MDDLTAALVTLWRVAHPGPLNPFTSPAFKEAAAACVRLPTTIGQTLPSATGPTCSPDCYQSEVESGSFMMVV
jgi:hypothetical protein